MVNCDAIPTLPIINFVINDQSYPLSGEDYVNKARVVGEFCMTAFSSIDQGKLNAD